MIDRYCRPAMKKVWSEQNKSDKWLAVELAVCEAWHQHGAIPESAMSAIWGASYNIQRIDEAFAKTKHDVTAFAMVYEDNTGGVNAGNEVEFFNPPIPGKTTLESNGLKFAITQGNDVKTNPVTLGRFSKIFALYLEILTGLGRIKNGFALTGSRDIKGSNNGRKENKFFHNVQVLGAHRSNMPRTGKAQK